MAPILRRSALSKNLPGVALAASLLYESLSAPSANGFANPKDLERIVLTARVSVENL
jgi:hypothetical protein